MFFTNGLASLTKSSLAVISQYASHGRRMFVLPMLGLALTACQGEINVTGDLSDLGLGNLNLNGNSTSTSETTISGSVGDGPIINAQIIITDATGAVVGVTASDAAASYSVSIPVGTVFPVIVTATGGTDVVTNSAPDFALVSTVANTSTDTVNINPFSTLIVKTAQVMPGGLTSVNISLAREYIADQLNFGLNSKLVPDPITTPINAGNVAGIIKASEALGETIRRTRAALLISGSSLTEDQIIDAMAADMTDGAVDGRGPGASAQIAATTNIVSGQVLVETITNQLNVGGADATALMDIAIKLSAPSATMTTADVVITKGVLIQAEIATAATSVHSPSSNLTAMAVILAGLQGNALAADIGAALPADPSSVFSAAIEQVALSTSNQFESVNASVRAGNAIPAPSPSAGAFEFSLSTYSVGESDGSVDLTINRTGDSSGLATVEWRTLTFNGHGTADWASDYNTVNWTQLTFADGETSKVVSVTINPDDAVEGNETFSTNLQSSNGDASVAVVTIIDDSVAPAPAPAPTPAPTPTPSPSVADYYVAPSGNDSNSGTSSAPFKTVQKAVNASNAGDLIYVRGGTYNLTSRISLTKSGSAGNLIRLFAYPGEKPVLDGSGVTSDQAILYLSNASYWHIKGFEVKDSAADGIRLKNNSSNNVIESNDVHGSGRIGQYKGNGISVWDTSGNNLILNNDSHHNVDLQGSARLGNADGFHLGPSGQGNVLMGNRAWKNSDDGFDLFNGAPTTLVNNWAWENGYDDSHNALGDGNGFKLGGGTSARGGHVIARNVSWKNKAKGYTENGLPGGPSTVANNTSFNNGGNGYKFNLEPHTLRNNLEYGSSGNNVAASDDRNNSWNMSPAVTLNTFLSTNDAVAKGQRQADGSLPESDFLKLASGAHVIDAGVLPGGVIATYLTPNGAPDLGAFEK